MPRKKKNPVRETSEEAVFAQPGRQGLTFEELARIRGIRPGEQLEKIIGGFTEEEFEGFDEALERWRREGL